MEFCMITRFDFGLGLEITELVADVVRKGGFVRLRNEESLGGIYSCTSQGRQSQNFVKRISNIILFNTTTIASF